MSKKRSKSVLVDLNISKPIREYLCDRFAEKVSMRIATTADFSRSMLKDLANGFIQEFFDALNDSNKRMNQP